MSDIRMDAYYYGFNKTNVDCIDELLSCVACAGKAFHNTSEWLEEDSPYGEHTVGKTPIEWIQNSAIKAANEITSLREQLEKAKSDDCLIQTLTDPENQPSQFGTVPIEWYENLENKLELYRFKVGEVIDSLDGSYEKHAIRKALQEAIEQ